jgi:hypothetical protein
MSFEEIFTQMIDARVKPLERKITELERELARKQGKGRTTISMNDAKRLLNCSDGQVRNYIYWGVIKKAEKTTPSKTAPYVFDLEEINFLKDNRHLLRRP